MDCSMPDFPVLHCLLEICSNSCPSGRWCHPTILSSVVPFSCLQSFPASDSFLMSLLFASGDQSIGASASVSVLPMTIQDWFPLGLTGLISLLSQGLTRVFSNTTVQKHQFFSTQLSFWSNSHHLYMTTGKTIALTRWTFVGKVMSLVFNMLSRDSIFLSGSKVLITFSFREQGSNLMAAITICSDFGAQGNSLSLFPLFPHLFATKWWDRIHDLSFLNAEF